MCVWGGGSYVGYGAQWGLEFPWSWNCWWLWSSRDHHIRQVVSSTITMNKKWDNLSVLWDKHAWQPRPELSRVYTVFKRLKHPAKTSGASNLSTGLRGGLCLQGPSVWEYDWKWRKLTQQCPIQIGRSLCKLSLHKDWRFSSFHLALWDHSFLPPPLVWPLLFDLSSSLLQIKTVNKYGWECGSVVKYFPRMCKALDSIVKGINTNWGKETEKEGEGYTNEG